MQVADKNCLNSKNLQAIFLFLHLVSGAKLAFNNQACPLLNNRHPYHMTNDDVKQTDSGLEMLLGNGAIQEVN